jgi:hypothetical protein
MTVRQDGGHCLAGVADSARRRRDLFVALDPSVAERLDRPIRTRQHRASLGMAVDLRIGTGLETAFGGDWLSHEAWGAWSAVEQASLPLLLAPHVPLPVRLRLELCAVIADGQVRHATFRSPARVVGAAEFLRSDRVVMADIEITEADLGPGRELDLVIEIDGLVPPVAAVGGGDTRLLGLGLFRVSVIDAPQVGGRGLVFQGRRLVHILGRARRRLREWGLARGSRHLVRALLRRLF